uniref:Fibronectin type-III domain-containing protein n=1 Tax=Amphimedon queenslandica TaxID=400682 RepID=A0A1X7VP48_AMPQE
MMGFHLSSIQLPAPQKQRCGIVLMVFILSGLCCFKTSNGECMQPAFSCEGSSNGSADGDMILDDCPSPDCVDVILNGSTNQANVSFSLDCTPTDITNCSYSYYFQYLTPDDGVVFHNSSNQPKNLTSFDVDRGYFILSVSDEDEFVPGSIIRIIVFLSSNISFNYSANVTIPGSFAPDVINFTVNSGNSTSLALSWQLRYPLVPPDMYYIAYNYTELSGANPRSDNSTIMIDEDDVTTTTDYILYTLDDLLPFTSYYVTLFPQYGEEEGEGLSDSGNTGEGMSSQVNDTNVDIDRDNMRLNISWAPPSRPAGNILRYEVTLSIRGKICLTINTTELSVIAEFKFNVTYTIRITPFNSFGSGTTRELDMFATPEGAPTPPLNFTLTELSLSSLKASWEEPSTLNGVLANYTVYCNLSSLQFYSQQLMLSFNAPPTTVDPDSTTANITGLYPFTNYDCYATASTGGGESSRSNNDSARTSEEEPAGPPEGFNVTDVTATSVSLEWRRPSVPNGVILHYFLQYSAYNVTIPVTFNTSSDEYSVTSYTVESLNEYTNYTFTISAVTSGGAGPLATTSTRTSEAG